MKNKHYLSLCRSLLGFLAFTGIVAVDAAPANKVVAWGDNGFQQSTVPSGLSEVIAIAAGGRHHTVALKSDGAVLGWGRIAKGESNVTIGLPGVKKFAVGDRHTLVLKTDGSLVGLGNLRSTT